MFFLNLFSKNLTKLCQSWVAAVGLCTLLGGCGGGASSDTNTAAPKVPTYTHLQEIRDCAAIYCPAMMAIQPGGFVMGSPASEVDREDDEGPQHQVSINKWLAVARHEVSFAQWDACVADGGCNGYIPSDEAWGRDAHPVINVSWTDVQAYLLWLNTKTGLNYRLLSEAEWEYAARAGTSSVYSWGDTIATGNANFDSTLGATVPVGSFPANPWGLYDMAGNVWEWTQDGYHDSYTAAPGDGSSWDSDSGDSRVLRGGGWNDDGSALRLAYRNYSGPNSRNQSVGFRVVRVLP